MSRFEDWARYNQMEKIRYFIKSLGFENINDSSSQDQMFEDKGNIIIIKEKKCK